MPHPPAEAGRCARQALRSQGHGEIRPALKAALEAEAPVRDLLVAAFSLSTYLRDLALPCLATLDALMTRPLEAVLTEALAAARDAWKAEDGKAVSDGDIMSRLRRAKRQVAFSVGLADLAGLIDGRQATAALSDLADAAVAATIDHLLLGAMRRGICVLPIPPRPRPAPASSRSAWASMAHAS